MAGNNASLLCLQIYVLDAALSDIVSSSLKASKRRSSSQRRRDSLSKQSQRQNLDKYWNLALSQGLNRYEGNHHSACYTCDSAKGALLQCSFCPNVQHRECGILLPSDKSHLSSWVCDSCLNDVDDVENDEDQEMTAEEDHDFLMLAKELDM